ncbi:MAG: hypothetical protein H6659_14010 [Ardenticatenaceae bacterium]|nr:hypothetical protein [Ardenticatenaceae bacterium]MCB8988585.1 hypothetical protein [Ardenticatenaceae bacterium]
MKGDFSRNTYNPKRRYRSVRMQQGRPLLDADWNEQADILNAQQSQGFRRMIGQHGGLEDGFLLTGRDTTAERPSLFLQPGSYFVEGVLCELDGEDAIPLAEQPYFPGAADHLTTALGKTEQALLYLMAWERGVTAVEDPELIEPALGGADTTTRTQVVWQVRALPLAQAPEPGEDVAGWPEWQALLNKLPPALTITRGYNLENELYRLEIHDAAQGDAPATWKWSRENGAIAFALQSEALVVEGQQVDVALVARPGLQAQLAEDDRVELTCRTWELDGRPGLMARIETYLEASEDEAVQKLRLELAAAAQPADLDVLQEAAERPLLRRWDQRPADEGTAVLPLPPGEAVALERGIMVLFPADESYQSGDYWQFVMRSEDKPGSQMTVTQCGPARWLVPLALLHRREQEWQLTDCRHTFQSLTDVFARLQLLDADLQATKAALAALHTETDVEDEEQEDEITLLQRQVAELRATVNQLAGRSDGRIVRTYRCQQELDVGEVVANSPTEDGYVVRAGPEAAPLGVVAPRPDDFAADEYVVVLRGPALCRVRGPVDSGDLLASAETPGHLEKAGLWTRWFQPERILGRAIDISTTQDFELIDVFVMRGD